ncbi:hypothetical protein ACFXPW_09615 [Streptomyces goshikiensis]|uniref:hypothetical protein n=1 Tax=Streptomyces goshikiensis TaxID=1942 RepID=UPI0036BFBD6A
MTKFAISRTAIIPKRGSTADECEDSAYCVNGPSNDHEDDQPIVAVISDGASESIFSGTWSRLITIQTANRVYAIPESIWGPGDNFQKCVSQLQNSWESWLADYIKYRSDSSQPLRWYEEEKIARGSFATFLAIHFEKSFNSPTLAGSWHAAALGDSCLFHIRGHTIMSHFPVESSKDFDITPKLLGSRASIERVCHYTKFTQGEFEHGDDFLLMTDSLAAWFLAVTERGNSGEISTILDSIRQVNPIDEGSAIEDWLTNRVARGDLRNDDMTLMHIRITG